MDEGVEVAVQHALGVSGLVAGSAVFHELVGVEDVAADPFPAETGVGGATPLLRQGGLPLLFGALHEPGLEDAHRGLLVRRLRTFVLALDDDPGRQVRDPDGAVGLVHVLAAGPLGAVGVDLQVRLVDLDVGVVGQERGDDYRRERRVAAMRLVERALADEPVLAALGAEDAVGVLAADREGRALQPRLLPRARLEQVDLELAVGSPALVHAEHHLRPVLGVGAAGARLQRDDRVAGVVLAVEECRLLKPLQLAPQRHDRGLDLVRHLGPELEQPGRVLVLAAQASVELEPPRDARLLRGDPLSTFLVVPEAGLAHRPLELGEALL